MGFLCGAWEPRMTCGAGGACDKITPGGTTRLSPHKVTGNPRGMVTPLSLLWHFNTWSHCLPPNMATTVGLIKGATEVVLGIGEVSIDNFTFKLFYKWSVSLFIAGSVAVCSSQFFGDPVACETVTFLNRINSEFFNFFQGGRFCGRGGAEPLLLDVLHLWHSWGFHGELQVQTFNRKSTFQMILWPLGKKDPKTWK